MLGWTVDRIDFLRRQMVVDRQLINLPGRAPHLAPVKTRASVRTFPLPQTVVDPSRRIWPPSRPDRMTWCSSATTGG